ncbi:UNVERIFIED_CONTAM: hypothetical protein Sradi_2520000 [Sesamum radiatum]|uniref:RNase H type-1 domain-containing protein n=1 Tax=Sesamum radiatum TaxID=300843 RepID=A0AAW2SKI4_SESRA
MYASNRPRVSDIAAGIARLRPVVGSSMAVELLSPYTKAEITKALFQMASFKSPGPDEGRGSWRSNWMLAKRMIRLSGPFLSSASSATSRAILDVLEIYRHASGQELNFVKSSVAFSKNTKSEVHRLIADTLQIRMENKMELYLGLPSKVARSKKDLFATIRDRVWQRISGWNAKLLSQVGKDVIIKSIIQAIPSYAMGCFRLPTTLLSELHGMVARFWWEIEAVAKFIGSPGPLWRILKHPDRLLSKVLRARYFPAGDIFAASPLVGTFIHLEKLDGGFTSVPLGCRWRVGSGSTIWAWLDPWLPRPYSFKPITTPPPTSDDIKVGIDDILVWYYSSFGLFTVRSAYHLICSLENSPGLSSLFVNEHAWWRFVWQAKVPNKIKVFIWKTCLNALPTSRNLLQRMPRSFSVCLHLFGLVRCSECRYGHLASSFCFLLLGRSALGVHKLNFDGALLGGGSAMGLGVVAQNDRGTCLAWLSRRVDRRGTGEVAKALAAWEAIQLAARRGWKSLIIEGDCVVLINKLRTVEGDLSSIGTVIFDILALVPIFSSCHFACVKRKLNSVAH